MPRSVGPGYCGVADGGGGGGAWRRRRYCRAAGLWRAHWLETEEGWAGGAGTSSAILSGPEWVSMGSLGGNGSCRRTSWGMMRGRDSILVLAG